jgi:hypothetical protein
MVTVAFSQENLKNSQTKTVSGTVSKIDFVGNTISIQTSDARLMSFFVPDNAIIVRDTQNIGLMDIKAGHPVTIQYDISSPGKDIVDSIVDNKPAAYE